MTTGETERIRHDESLLELLRGVDTPTVSNALEVLDFRARSEGFPSVAMRCLFPELGVMCGYAVTAQVETMSTGNALEEERFVDLFQAVEDSQKPAIVVLQEIGRHRDWAAHSGEVMATIFSTLGAIGLVTDCAVRDLAAVRGLKFHYFARGAVSSHAHFRIVQSNVPVDVLGMSVRPGDLIHGDENGLISMPAEKAALLPAAIRKVMDGERNLLDRVRQPGFRSALLRGKFLH
jgi:regulator of RNase E activity RraA